MQKELEEHPVANIFPAMDPDDLKALADDIKKHGQREPILLAEGKIIDGRSRYAACKIAGVEPITRWWGGADKASLVSFVISLNLHRRHLTPSQCAAVAADVEPFYAAEAKGRQVLSQFKLPQNLVSPLNIGWRKLAPTVPTENGRAAEQAAKATGASPRNVVDAKKIKESDPKLH